MGRLINEERIVNNQIDRYLERSTSEYTKFLDSTPNFVTYYQRDRISSTYDKGLENVEKHLGSTSPNKFNKIEKFPLYGIDSLSLSLERGDGGLETSFEGEAIILPNTTKPSPDDFFTFGYINDVYIFKVNGIANDTIKNKPFYRISFSLSKKVKREDYVEDFISEEYISLFDNIGTQYDNVVKKTDFIIIDYIDKLLEVMFKVYTRNFYNRSMNIIECEFPNKIHDFNHRHHHHTHYHYYQQHQHKKGINVYNRHLNKFIMDNELFKLEKSFLSDIYLVDIIKHETIQFYEMYKHTLYYAIEKKDRSIKIAEYLLPHKINSDATIFTHYTKESFEAYFTDVPFEQTYNLFTKGLVEKITKNFYDPFTTKEYLLENIIIDYMWNKLDITTNLLDELNKIDLYPDRKCYALLPLIMFILKDYRNKLITKIN